MTPISITHVAGEAITGMESDGARVVQRCAWCGALLINEPRGRLETDPPVVDGDPPPTYPLWPAGDLVRITFQVEVGRSIVVRREWLQPDGLPVDSCILRSPVV